MICAFCDSEGEGSVEHVVPLWLGDVLLRSQPPTARAPGGKRMTHRFTPASDNAEPLLWHTDGPSFRTRAICRHCNNGWLSDLESAVAPLLTRLVCGEPASLATDQQALLSAWSYKTVLLLQLIRPRAIRSIPAARFHEFFSLRRPPSDSRLWLGASEGASALHETSTELVLANPRHRVPGYFTALALGRLLILCAGRLRPGPEQLRVGSDSDPRAAHQVWPASLRAVPWPPPEPLSDLRAKSLVALL
jgi:hypothetical protein